MRYKKEKIESIRQFIVNNLSKHPADITAHASKKLGITRQTAHKYLKELISEGYVHGSGKTKGVQYEFVPVKHKLEFPMDQVKSESDIWTGSIVPILPELAENVRGKRG